MEESDRKREVKAQVESQRKESGRTDKELHSPRLIAQQLSLILQKAHRIWEWFQSMSDDYS